jgi:glycosyltransferase involved in cell wall biosynthesis
MKHTNIPWLMPISKNLKNHVEGLIGAQYKRLTYLPMGVDDMLFTQSKLNTKYNLSEAIRICYLGSYQTLGVSAGLEQLIFNLNVLTDLSVDLSIAGVGNEGMNVLERYLSDIQFTNPNPQFHLYIRDWISHESVPSFLSSFHALVLPYPESSINFYRFPIKSLEYAASGIPILCSDTSSHRTIFGASEVFFYDTTNPLSLREKIYEIFKDPSERKRRSAKAIYLAKEHTYAKRAKTLIDAVLLA